MMLRLRFWIFCASAVAAATALFSQPAAAQSHAGNVFIQLFYVGSSPEQMLDPNFDGPEGGFQQGITGSVGCGSGDGTNLGGTEGIDQTSAKDLFNFCNNLTANNAAGWNNSTASTPGNIHLMEEAQAPDEAFAQTDQASAMATLQINNVSQRLTAIRLVRRGLGDLGGYAFERGEQAEQAFAMTDPGGLQAPQSNVKGGAFAAALHRGFSSGDGFLGIEGLGVFLNGEYTRLDASNSSHEVGSDGNGGGFTLGIDKKLGESAFLGLATGYSYLSTDLNHDFGDSKLNDVTFSTYGSAFFGEHVYVDGIVSGSILLFDQKRTVPTGLGGNFNDIKSDPDGWNVTGDLGLGGEFSAKPFDLNPYLRAAVSRTEVDSYKEHGSSLALEVNDQESTSVTLTPGLSVSLPVSASFGVVSPYVRGEYVHEFGDQAANIRGNLALIPEAGFKLTPNNTDHDYGNVGGGVTTTFAKGISAFVDYNALVGFEDLLVQRATIGARFEF